MMTGKFTVGDHVTWNSEAGHVSGKIIKVHTKDVNYKGHMRRVSEADPQYEIKSDKTDHIAMHKGSALHKLKPVKRQSRSDSNPSGHESQPKPRSARSS